MRRLAVWLSLAAVLGFAQTDCQVSGVVVDHLTNRPLNRVLVQLIGTGKDGGDASALTEADGRFTFLHVPAGKYQLMAERRGQMPEGFHADDAGYATAIVVDGHQKTDGIVFAMRTDASVNGTVRGDDGDAVRDAQIDIFHESVSDGEAQVVQMRGGRTNSAGQFHFGHLAGGNYYVSVEATPWFAQGGGMDTVYPVTFYGDATDANSARVIALQEGGAASLQINLHAVPGIHVKLPEGMNGVALFVPGPGGAKIPSPANFMGGRQRIRRNLQLMPQNSQQMELTNLAAGRYEVVKFGENGGLGESTETVDLVDGSSLNFERAGPSTISGTVVLEGKRPKEDLEVFFSSGQRGGMQAEVAADGTFTLAKGAAGRFRIHLNTPDLTISSVSAKGARMVHDNLEVPSGSAVELTIHAVDTETLSTVEGFAVRDNVGIAGAMVLLMPQDLGSARLIRRDQSDADGSFSLAGVLPGRYTLLAIDDGHDLAYKSEGVIKPYLDGGVALTIPLKGNEAIAVPIQARKR
jgi:hypothetical protein